MADRYPLVVASGTVQELADADNLDLTGNNIVGINSIDSDVVVTGVSTFNSTVSLSMGTTDAPSLTAINDTNTGIFFPANDVVSIASSSKEILRVDSLGRVRVGVGTTSGFKELTSIDGYLYSGTGTLIVTNSLSPYATIQAWSAANEFDGPGILDLGHTRGTLTVPEAVNPDDICGTINTVGYDGQSYIRPTAIMGIVDGTVGINSMPGRLSFRTTGIGASNPVERMRINTNGAVLIGTGTSNGNYLLQVNSQIFATSATIATSDEKYKENVAPLDSCLNVVNALNPVSFTWKKDNDIIGKGVSGKDEVLRVGMNFPSGTQVGFIAQEVQEALGDASWLNSIIKENVREEVVDIDGNVVAPEEEFLGIAEGNMIAILTKAIQELSARVAELEAK